MFMNILVIIFVLSVSYAWMTRGIFNAMIHALCVLFAGAVAFAVWEPLAMILLGLSDAAIVEGAAWGIALIVPFIIVMLVLRVISDKVITANVQNIKALDYAGGAAFGLVTSILTAGVMVIGISYMRLPSGFLGYQPVWYAQDRAGAGSLVENDKLWIPVDSITAMVYQNLSTGSMSSGEPLKKWYPDLTLTGFAARINPGEGSARNAITEDAFSVMSSYTIGQPTDAMSLSVGDQRFMDIKGKVISPQNAGHVAGYVVEFGPEAKEKGGKGGQVVISNGQVRLLTKQTDGTTHTIFPIATISESNKEGQFGRWMFDSEDLFITSSGGKSRVPMAFEFFIPADQEPAALYVKNIRVPVGEIKEPTAFANAAARDKLVRSGALVTGERVKREFDLSDAIVVDASSSEISARFRDSTGEVLPSQLVKQRGIKINDDNLITEGIAKFRKEEIGRRNTPQVKSLRVDQFWFGEGQQMVQVEVGSGIEGGFLSEAARKADPNEPFMLIDTNGNEYEAVGYVYEDPDTELFEIRYTPGSTISGQNEKDLPRISQSKDGQKLSLIFLISNKVEIQYFTIGDVVLVHYDPVLQDD
ncbi:MAG: CvpA family protein [Phycisphaerales bacterium]